MPSSRRRIRGLLDDPLVEYIGEIGEAEKSEFLGNALACGTPVIAFARGSVSEVIEDGRSGRLVHSIEEAVDAIQGLGAIHRSQCRAAFEERFTVSRMAEDYVASYVSLAEGADASPRTCSMIGRGS